MRYAAPGLCSLNGMISKTRKLILGFLAVVACLTLSSDGRADTVTSFATREILARVLIERCIHFGGVFHWSSWQCARLTLGMLRDLDADFDLENFKAKTSASFRSELQGLLAQEKVARYLRDTFAYLDSHVDAREAENLWSWTLKYTDQNRDQALQWIAVLLQDTAAGAHVAYLRAHGQDAEALQSLEDVGRDLDNFATFSCFPMPLHVDSRAQYHFYVMAYLARKLDQRHPGSPLALVLPMLFNTTYEYALTKGPVGALGTLHPFEAEKFKDMLEDTYLGYAGALWGLGREKEVRDFESFAKSFSSDPERYLESLLRQ